MDEDDRRIIERSILEVDVFCGAAGLVIRSHSPIGLGEDYRAEAAVLDEACEDIARRYRRLIRKAQREHGWATKR